MTDNTFLPAGAPAEAAGGNRRNIVLAAVLGAAVLGGGGYYFLAGSSSSEDVVSAPPVVRQQPVKKAPAKTVKPAAKAAKPAVLPAVSSTRIGRNPFEVQVGPAPAEPAGATTPLTPTGTAAGSTAPGASTVNAPYTVTLKAISSGAGGTAREYTFSYLNTTKKVIVAQRFGLDGHIVVLAYVKNSAGSVTGAYVQVGDADPIEVKIGGSFTAR